MSADPRPYCNPKVPTHEVNRILGQVHVGTPADEVAELFRDKCATARANGIPGWSAELERQTVRYALWRHRANRSMFSDVMGGHLLGAWDVLGEAGMIEGAS